VRLYTKPGAFAAWPLVTMALPLASLAVLTFCVARPETLGISLQKLYMTWSPYHYGAQAYGLAVLYSYRSGCRLLPADKRLLFWTSMLPFLNMAIVTEGLGLRWLLPAAVFSPAPVSTGLSALGWALAAAAFAGPPLLFLKVWKGPSGPMPLIALMAVVSNTVWFFVLQPMQAMVWATVFHGLQYLAIVLVFHVRDRKVGTSSRGGALREGVRFYAISLGLAYALFLVLPRAYVALGYGPVESVLVVVAAINIHHFIVDAYIWRLRKADPNRSIVDSLAAPARAIA